MPEEKPGVLILALVLAIFLAYVTQLDQLSVITLTAVLAVLILRDRSERR